MEQAAGLVFVSIAAYRDPQLLPTIQDCIAKASNAERLRFGVCWQHGDEEAPVALWNDPRFRVLDVNWRHSKGACWARAEVMKLWAGEPWFLQVDSHCRFRAGWDDFLIGLLSSLDQPKAVVSTYATPFVPGEHEVLQDLPLQMAFHGFTPEGIPHMKPLGIREGGDRTALLRARFLSAGFLFAPGRFVQDVPYDPELYFLGEEAAMTLRAFTSGYALFHPRQTVVWHDYVRADATKHWDDHVEGEETVNTWGEQDLRSKERVHKLLAGERLQAFNLGEERTLTEYEAYAGISFRARRVQDYTMRALEPPNPPCPADWAESVYLWMVRLAIPRADLPVGAQQAAFWCVGVHDELGNEIYRRDLTRSEIERLPQDGPEIILVCELQSGVIPATWTVWPVDAAHHWMRKMSGQLQDGDYAVVLEDPPEE